jgi:hypothetical protein
MNTHNNQPAKPKRKSPNISMVPQSPSQARHLNVQGEPVTRTHSTAGGAESIFDGWIVVEIATGVVEAGAEVAGSLAAKAIESAGEVIS